MKVNLNVTLDVTDADRWGIRDNVGLHGLATHREVRQYLRAYLRSAFDELNLPGDTNDEDRRPYRATYET